MIKRLFSTIKNYPIIITDDAWSKMSEIIIKQNSKSFLLSASSGGCNGFNYEFNLLNNVEHNNFINKYEVNKITEIKNNDIILLIDPLSEFLLFGTTIDYVSSDYNKNIFESKFIFKPDKNLATSCGCGISFTPKN